MTRGRRVRAWSTTKLSSRHPGHALAGATLAILLAAGSARADLTAAYDGSLTLARRRGTASIAGALTQAGGAVSGTLAMAGDQPEASGTFWVVGQIRGTRVSLTGGSTTGASLKWKGKLAADGNLSGRARVRGGGRKLKGMLALARRVPEPPGTPPRTCDSSYFTGQVMGRILQPICGNCHVTNGAAAMTSFRVTPGDPLATQESVALHVDHQDPAASRLLQKPLARQPHGGGAQLVEGSETYAILAEWADRVATGRECESEPVTTTVPLAPHELLVRAAMDVRGRRPAPQELDAVESDPAAYGAIVDGYLHSPEFLERVKDVYDDALLVRREDFSDESRDETAAIYGEGVELIAWIVASDRPFSEIGTATFTVANELFQRDIGRMPFPMEPVTGASWQPTHYTDGRPHAGVLSTSAFYSVWDTNNTNKNRRRANRWSILFHCYNFLDTPVDVTRNVDNNDASAVLNAVTTRPDCKACHDRLDPLASFLFPLDNAQQLEGGDGTDFFSGNPERWRRANRRPPAVYGVPGTDIADMGRLMVANPKFAECQTKRAFTMLFLRAPQTTAEVQTASDIASRWPTEDGYEFRRLVRRWMLSDAYRSRPRDHDPAWVRRASPERLETLIEDLTGFVWTREPDDDQDDADPESDPPRLAPVPLLTTVEDGFKVILGGIDGESVAGRSYSLNASVVNVQRKVAALAADHVVMADLALPDAERKLLAGVTGGEDPALDETALRAHIVRLVRRLYGEPVAPDAPQVQGWLNLYAALFADRTQTGTGSNSVPGTPGERAWRGLLTAMLRSPKIVLY